MRLPNSRVLELPEQREVRGRAFPLVLGPDGSFDPAVCRDAILGLARDHGGILFRGFDVPSPEAFATFVETLRIENMPYVGGAAVRTPIVGDRVFTANESPPGEPVPFHHEMAQVPEPPAYIFFYGDRPSVSGGETPIVLSHEVYSCFLEEFPGCCEAVEAHGIQYIRVMPEVDDPSSSIGRSWKATFQVDSRVDAEAVMRQLGTRWKWLEDGNLKTITATVPAIRRDPRTGEKQFFNSMVAAYKGWVDARNDPKQAVRLGNGGAIDATAMEALYVFMREHCVAIPWEKNDVLMLDNGLVLHARNPFVPPRRILASIGKAAM